MMLIYVLCIKCEIFCFLTFLSEIFILRVFYIVNFGAFATILFKDTYTRIGGTLSLFMLII
jgi:hypothetical protein